MKTVKEQLREIGYTGETDLESLLDALPEKIENNKYYLTLSKKLIGYVCKTTANVYGDFYTLRHSYKGGKNESLADCAGRLIVKLYEQNLINFNKYEI